jgi:energy-converting hydrogenase B subunit D
MMAWIALLLVILMLAAAVAVLVLRNLLGAVAAASVVSLAVSVLFVLLRAPDVALTEAAVGAGLSSLVLALGLRRLGLWRLEGDRGVAHALVPSSEREQDDA